MISVNFRRSFQAGALSLLFSLTFIGCSGKPSEKLEAGQAGTASEADTATTAGKEEKAETQSEAGAVAYQVNICSDSLAEVRDSLEQVGTEAKGDAKTIVEEASVMAEDLGVGLEEILDDVEKVPESDTAKWKELFTELSDALVDLESLGERVETLATSEGRGGVVDTFSKLTESYEAAWAAMDESIDLAAKIAGLKREVPES